MPKPPFCVIFVVLLASARSLAAQGQCACRTISAVGVGNTNCSASEGRGVCTIDYNLFGPESEKRAAMLLRKCPGGDKLIAPKDDAPAADALDALSSREKEFLDALLIYVAVAAGDQSSRAPETVPLGALCQFVTDVRSDVLAKPTVEAFSSAARREWADYSNERLRMSEKPVPVETIGRAIVSPGCIEFNTDKGLWMMFKAQWSPARIQPRCGGPIKAKSSFWRHKELFIGIAVGAAAEYASNH